LSPPLTAACERRQVIHILILDGRNILISEWLALE
jgi:hypothetical protein